MAGNMNQNAPAVPTPAVIAALHTLAGRLDVPSGEAFTAEVWVTMDTPKWTVRLMGSSDEGKGVNVVLGEDQPHLLMSVPHLDDGNYVLSISAVLQASGGRFQMVAKSSGDEERSELGTIPGNPLRLDAMPVRVG
jgi:hypothetical protein